MFLGTLYAVHEIYTINSNVLEISQKYDALENKLNEASKATKALQDEVQYLLHAEGKVFSWWPAGSLLDYNDLYSTVSFVLEKCPVTIPDKPGFISLIIETIATESRFGLHNTQLRGGKAVGIIQMEPNTFKCIQANYLKYNPELITFILQFKDRKLSDLENLKVNVQYAVAYAIVHYIRAQAHLADLKTPDARWLVYKKTYNTELGAATEEKFHRDRELYLKDYYS
jgi:hypothetical protein